MSSTMKGMTRCSVGRVYRAVPSSSLSLVLGQLESVQTSEGEQESRREEGRGERTGREVAASTLSLPVANSRNGAWPLTAITMLHMKRVLYCQLARITNRRP